MFDLRSSDIRFASDICFASDIAFGSDMFDFRRKSNVKVHFRKSGNELICIYEV